MKKVVIAGGTGFIGRHLSQRLVAAGYEVVVIARRRNPRQTEARFVGWDGHSPGAWQRALDGAVAVVNLAGRTVDCVKTPDNCDEILRSRVDTTRLIGEAMRQMSDPPPVWVQMSTAHIYGDPAEQRITEASAFGYGLAPTVGKAWEAALLENLPAGTREVRLRTSFVIGRDGGALGTLRRITRLGLGGTVGHGQQGLSWIHEEDVSQIILNAIQDPAYTGPYIVSAPHPVSQRDFMRALREAMNVPVALPAPAWLTRLGAHLIFRTDPELVLYGRYVYPQRLLDQGYRFRFDRLPGALADLVG